MCRWYLTPGPDTNFFSKKVKAEKGKYVMWPASWTCFYEDRPTPESRYMILCSIYEGALAPYTGPVKQPDNVLNKPVN